MKGEVTIQPERIVVLDNCLDRSRPITIQSQEDESFQSLSLTIPQAARVVAQLCYQLKIWSHENGHKELMGEWDSSTRAASFLVLDTEIASAKAMIRQPVAQGE